MNCVIDANLLAVANLLSKHATLSCAEQCIKLLGSVQGEGGCVSVDENGEIFTEYSRHANHKGQPGVGDAFFKWLFQNQGYEIVCEKVSIKSHHERGYEEYPDSPKVADFDRSDRKYVAVALSSRYAPAIHNAVDSDWKEYELVFASFGVVIVQHCL